MQQAVVKQVAKENYGMSDEKTHDDVINEEIEQETAESQENVTSEETSSEDGVVLSDESSLLPTDSTDCREEVEKE